MTKPVWQIETLRKTFFVPSGTAMPIPSGGWWKAVTGTDPTDETVKPLLKTSTESGQWNDYSLTVGCQPGRIDFVLSPLPLSIGPGLPNIGQYRPTVDAFNTLSPPQGLARISRVAFGAVALAPYNSHEECYAALGSIITHVEVSPTSREFLYRINNPAIANAHAGLSLNCISTWGAIKLMQLMADVQPSESILYAIRAELDISSDAEVELPPDVDISALFQEFSTLGFNILESGPSP